MTAHDHTEFVPGCYRCDLNLDEMPTPLEAAVAADEAYMDDHANTVDGDSEERVRESLTAALDAAMLPLLISKHRHNSQVAWDEDKRLAEVIRKKILGEEA